MITLPEFMRRMKDMQASGGGGMFGRCGGAIEVLSSWASTAELSLDSMRAGGSGGGGNGKSKLMELLEKSVGDYGCKLPITLLTATKIFITLLTTRFLDHKDFLQE